LLVDIKSGTYTYGGTRILKECKRLLKFQNADFGERSANVRIVP